MTITPDFTPRHAGIIDITVSEDGSRKMCCLCFEFKTLSELNRNAAGEVEDVCAVCAAAELAELKRRRDNGTLHAQGLANLEAMLNQIEPPRHGWLPKE